MEKIDKITKKKYNDLHKQELYLKNISNIFRSFIEEEIFQIPVECVSDISFSEDAGVVYVRINDPIFLSRLNTQKEYIKYKLNSFDKKIKDISFIL